MRYAKDRKDRTRQQILFSAYRRFATQGFAGTSIEQIMRDCQLTRGGFYAHFQSKSELYRDSMALAKLQQRASGTTDNWTDSLLNEYLEDQSTAFLATDIASSDPEVRSAYQQAFVALNEQIKSKLASHSQDIDAVSVALTTLIVGAISISKSIDDSALKSTVADSCKKSAKAVIDGAQPTHSFFWEPPTPAERSRLRSYARS